MNDKDRCRLAADDINEFLMRVNEPLYSFEYDRASDKEGIPFSLFRSVLDMSLTCRNLLFSYDLICIPIILRSQIDALAKLAMLSDNIDKVDELKSYSLEEQLKNGAKCFEHEPLADAAFNGDVATAMEALKEQVTEYNRQEFFATAIVKNHLEDHRYLDTYKLFCSDAHSDATAIFTRYKHGFTWLNIASYIESMVGNVFFAAELISRVLKVYSPDELKQLHGICLGINVKYVNECLK